PRRLEIEAEQKEQQQSTEFGEIQSGFDVGDDAQAPRADHHSRSQIAQHGAQLGALKQRNQHHGGEQKNCGLFDYMHGGRPAITAPPPASPPPTSPPPCPHPPPP